MQIRKTSKQNKNKKSANTNDMGDVMIDFFPSKIEPNSNVECSNITSYIYIPIYSPMG